MASGSGAVMMAISEGGSGTSLSLSLGRNDSVELCFRLTLCSLNWEARMKRAFCSATWAVRSSSLDSHEGRLSVRWVKLSRGVTEAAILWYVVA